ncbi:uncharacterized protein LOC113504185 [Trichoplusia ni]|uniref:Uncharacterized protein LOC113504185 n=1 Tax=Trichoplusia ni TaxID=7111 RepID=A0A7E5WN31_TRINI|nr:uncharacterized protein LOC113504185 [Trichoplusia ni]
MSPLTALLALAALCPIISGEHQFGVCKLDFCNCTPDTHPSWKTVNCTLQRDQKLDILEGDLPETTTDLIVSGSGVIMLGANSLSRLRDARRIYINGAEIVFMRSYAAANLDVLYLHLDVENCDVIRIEEKAFVNIKGPLSVTIKNCESVSTEGQAFSWLLNMNISNVRTLQLGPGSFTLDPSAGNVGEHGPGMSIRLRNLTVPAVPTQTFGSSAAEIVLDNVKINEILAGAFSANTYNIVMALNSSIQNIDEDAFSQRSLINNLYFFGCKIQQISSRALQSAVGNLNISYTLIENIETGGINITVASVVILDSEFNRLMERSIELSSWNKLHMERNSFDELVPHAIIALDTTTHEQSAHELTFIENEVETAYPTSLKFIGQAQSHTAYTVVYKDNYYGQTCYCNISNWLADVLGTDLGGKYKSESFCTVDEFLARCFNEPEQNILFDKFLDGVCQKDSVTFHCESYVRKADGTSTEIKNPRFPHKNKHEQIISERDKKVIGIVIVTCLGCVVIVMFISFVRWMRRKGYCINVKNFLISSNLSCGSLCDRLCNCGVTHGMDNARSISRLSVNEYSERHCLNEPMRVQEMVHESTLNGELVPTEDKTTQTLPEELTKELLENLKERLESPENYVEARETIEHLYVLTKLEENRNANVPKLINVEENIYELPFQATAPRIGKNKKPMISVGTRTPSLDKLLPLSPYNRQTALVHEYFEPKDLAVHLYAEIANNEKEKRTLLGNIPDVVAEQAAPRGPYLRAVREKKNTSGSQASPVPKSLNNSTGSRGMSTIKSNTSNTSAKMLNRPLPEKPITLDPGEGTSFKHG